MTMAISFDQIPNSILVPGQYIEISNTGAIQGLFGMPSRVLLIGQKFMAAPAAPSVPFIFGDVATVEGQCGRGSMLHRMADAFRAANPFTEAWALPLEDFAGGVAASGTVTFSGTIAAAGTLNLYIAGRRVRVAVSAIDTPTDVAANLEAAVNADTQMPVVASSNTGVLTLTARHKGEVGNSIDVRVNYFQGEFLPQGLTASIVAMANGTGNPDIAPSIAALGDTWWTDVVMPYTDGANLSLIEEEAEARNGPLIMRDMTIYAARSGTYAQLITFASTRNSQHLFVMGAAAPPLAIEDLAASYAGVASYYSHIDPARPLQTLALPGIKPPAIGDIFPKFPERQVLLENGVGTFMVDDGGAVRIERAVSTYITNAYGVPDPSWRDLETKKTLAWLRFQRRARVASKFPRHKLASDGTRAGSGQSLVTPRIIRADGIAQFRQWEEQGIVEDVSSWIPGYLVERDATDQNRVNELLPADVVNQLRVFAGRIQFRL